MVGGDEQVDEIRVEGGYDVLSARVGELGIQDRCGDAEALEEDLQLVGRLDAVDEHQDLAGDQLQLEKRIQDQVLVLLATHKVKLRQLRGHPWLLEFQQHRLVQHEALELLDLLGKRRRHQHGLVGRRHHHAHGPHVLLVAEGEHQVRLVDDQDFERVREWQHRALPVLGQGQQRGGCCHQDGWQLGLHVLLPRQQRLRSEHIEAKRQQGRDDAMHLHDELLGGHKHQPAQRRVRTLRFGLGQQPLDEGHGVRQGLAAASPRTAQQVLALQRDGDAARLHKRRPLQAQRRGDRLGHSPVEVALAELGPGHGGVQQG
mmetsp:Transcript_102887/g.297494  ORF Transcript_102887/g.297494 Transcript_102887/m.297494 type:complete len:316 (+) Transcript_102887:1444-2391(+)